MDAALPILPYAKTSACPVIGQLGNRLDHLFRKCARTFCRYEIADGPARVAVLCHDLWRKSTSGALPHAPSYRANLDSHLTDPMPKTALCPQLVEADIKACDFRG
jgi:hypothetical protein